MIKNLYIMMMGVILVACGKRSATLESNAQAALLSSPTVVALKPKTGAVIELNQASSRSVWSGIKCSYKLQSASSDLPIVPTTQQRILSPNGADYFIQLRAPIAAENCSGTDTAGKFDYKFFYVSSASVELITSNSATPAPLAQIPTSTDDLRSRRAENLARDIERRRSGGGKSCGLSSFGARGCWACVGWSMTDTGLFPKGLGSDADSTPNGFLRATQSARARKGADGVISINGVRFLSLKAQYGGIPSLAPRGSILFCNTSAAGHAAVITNPGNEMRSDVVEIIGATYRQSLCWEQVQEILFPID